MTKAAPAPVSDTGPAQNLIYPLRGTHVILDSDIAAYFGKTTSAVNQNRSRNAARFPPDYAFELTETEWRDLGSQFVISSAHGGRRTPPWAYTEHGFIMLSMSFRGDMADRMARIVIDTFVAYRRGTLELQPALAGEGAHRRNSVLAMLYDMMDSVGRMPLPTGNDVADELKATTEDAIGSVRALLRKPKIENQKVQAEIAQLMAATEKAYAETRKLDAETASIWTDTILRRLDILRQIREMTVQLERDELVESLQAFERPGQALLSPD